MTTASNSEEWILRQFDESAESFTFPDLGHGYYFLIDARLHAYSDGNRWALIVEIVGYNPRAGNVVDVLHTYGNCLTAGGPGFENGDFLDRVDNFDEVEADGQPETASGRHVRVRGREIDLAAQRGEELSSVFRRLVPGHRALLLADEAELRRRIPSALPEIMTLEEWHQPDLFETKPSQSEIYRQLATVLSTADANRYDPTQTPNTHWENWPESGSL